MDISPHERACRAISHLQAMYMALDGAMDAKKLFGVNYMPMAGLEDVIESLVGILDDLPDQSDLERKGGM